MDLWICIVSHLWDRCEASCSTSTAPKFHTSCNLTRRCAILLCDRQFSQIAWRTKLVRPRKHKRANQTNKFFTRRFAAVVDDELSSHQLLETQQRFLLRCCALFLFSFTTTDHRTKKFKPACSNLELCQNKMICKFAKTDKMKPAFFTSMDSYAQPLDCDVHQTKRI